MRNAQQGQFAPIPMQAWASHRARLWRLVDDQQLTNKRASGPDGGVNSGGQRCYIVIACTNDDSGMRHGQGVKPLEVAAIEGQNCSVVSGAARQDVGVGQALICHAGVDGSLNVMAEPTEVLNHRQTKVLVGL